MSAIQDEIETNNCSTTSNMLKNKFMKKTILRRDSDLAPFRPSPPIPSKSDVSIPTSINSNNSELTSLSRPRTREDEQIYLNTGKISPIIKESPKFRRPSVISDGYESPLRGNFPQTVGDNNNNSSSSSSSSDDDDLKGIDEFIDRLNIGKIGEFIKKIILYTWKKIQSSKYINSENDGKLHLQSFAIGVILTSIVVMIQPFLIIYLDSWIVLLCRLFKHLMAWILVIAIISYIFNPKKQTTTTATSNSMDDQFPGTTSRINHFDTKLQYKVKSTSSSNHSSRSTSPNKFKPIGIKNGNINKKSSPRPSFSQRNSTTNNSQISLTPSMKKDVIELNQNIDGYNEQLLLKNVTERNQIDERARWDQFQGAMDRPKDNYERFMNVAYRKNQEVENYNKFVEGGTR